MGWRDPERLQRRRLFWHWQAGRLIMHGQLTGAARPFPLLNRCLPLREKRVRVASAAGADTLAACCCARLDTKLWR